MYFTLLDEASSSSKPKKGTRPADDDNKEKQASKRGRTAFTRAQKNTLMEAFAVSQYPETHKREDLAKALDVGPIRVQVR